MRARPVIMHCTTCGTKLGADRAPKFCGSCGSAVWDDTAGHQKRSGQVALALPAAAGTNVDAKRGFTPPGSAIATGTTTAGHRDLAARAASSDSLRNRLVAMRRGADVAKRAAHEAHERLTAARRAHEEASRRLADLESGRGARLAAVGDATLFEFWLELPGYSGPVRGAASRVTQHGAVQHVGDVKGTTKGGVGGAAVGWLLLGPAGGIVGAVASRKTEVTTDVRSVDARQFEIEVIGPGFAWSCIQGAGAGAACRSFRDLLNGRSTSNDDVQTLARAQAALVQARRIELDGASAAAQAAQVALTELNATSDQGWREYLEVRLSPLDEMRSQWAQSGPLGRIAVVCFLPVLLWRCLLRFGSAPAHTDERRTTLRPIMDGHRRASVLVALIAVSSIAVVALITVSESRRLERERAAVTEAEARAQREREERDRQLRAAAPAVAVELSRLTSLVSDATSQRRYDDLPSLLAKADQLVLPYHDMVNLPPALADSIVRSSTPRHLADTAVRTRDLVRSAQADIEAGSEAQKVRYWSAALQAYTHAGTLLTAIDEGNAFAPERAELMKLTKQRIAAMTARVSKQQTVPARAQRVAATARPPVDADDLERTLQARCGRSVDASGEWIMEGSEARALCRRDVELELERRR